MIDFKQNYKIWFAYLMGGLMYAAMQEINKINRVYGFIFVIISALIVYKITDKYIPNNN